MLNDYIHDEEYSPLCDKVVIEKYFCSRRLHALLENRKTQFADAVKS